MHRGRNYEANVTQGTCINLRIQIIFSQLTEALSLAANILQSCISARARISWQIHYPLVQDRASNSEYNRNELLFEEILDMKAIHN
ncbi:hypothetical protein NC652_006588 [Populus alba x Populus x berolinensis]|nr:hypothetical protein NC652_006588 [Populus alba x Populus x berolinensis]